LLATIADLQKTPEELEPYFNLATSLSTKYDELLENYPGDSHKRRAGVHASELVKCKRQVSLCVMETEKREQIDPLMRKRFGVGHALHDLVQKDLIKMAARETARQQMSKVATTNGWYMEFEPEVVVAPELQPLAYEYQLTSSCDGVFTFRWEPEGKPFLRVGLEIKTEAPDSFASLSAPKPDHIEQVTIYQACLDLPLIWFFYFNKGNQNNTPSRAPWLIPFNPEIWEKLRLRAADALHHVAMGTLPDREEGYHCTFCPYSYVCQPLCITRKNTRFVSVRRPGGP
jgi:hypothetical protein